MLLKTDPGSSRETFWIGIQSLHELLNFQVRFLITAHAVTPLRRSVALYPTHCVTQTSRKPGDRSPSRIRTLSSPFSCPEIQPSKRQACYERCAKKMQDYNPAPRDVIEVGTNSAVSRCAESRAATRLRTICKDARGSTNKSTEGPAPLSAAPSTPSFAVNSSRHGSSGQSAERYGW